jgi:hypothetical protein
MIWFILIYVATLILFGIIFYFDMDKGESLEDYFNGIDRLDFILMFLFPIFNTIALIIVIFYVLSSNIWEKIKHWEK